MSNLETLNSQYNLYDHAKSENIIALEIFMLVENSSFVSNDCNDNQILIIYRVHVTDIIMILVSLERMDTLLVRKVVCM